MRRNRVMGAGASSSSAGFKKQVKQISKDLEQFDREYKALESAKPQNLTEQLAELQDKIKEQKDQERVAAESDEYDQAKKCKEEAAKLEEGVGKLLANREEQQRLIAEAWRLQQIFEAGRLFYKEGKEYDKAKEAFEKRNAIEKQRKQLVEWQLGSVGQGTFDEIAAAEQQTGGAAAEQMGSSGLDLKWADWRSGKGLPQGPDRKAMELRRKQQVFGGILFKRLAPPMPVSGPAAQMGINQPRSQIYQGVHGAFRAQASAS